jgi:M6 family metalloprotease-like protein
MKFTTATTFLLSLLASSTSNASHRQLSPSKGEFNILWLLVQFRDHVDGRNLPTAQYYDDLCRNHIRPYFQEQSYQQYNISCTIKDWKVTDNTEAHYAGGVSGKMGALEAAAFFVPILDDLSANDPSFNVMDFDADGDGYMDNTVVIHSGFSAVDGNSGVDCQANNVLNRFMSQGGPASDGAWMDPSTFVELGGYVIATPYVRTCNFDQFAHMGVIVHEWVHTLVGKPDPPTGLGPPTGPIPIDTYDGTVLGGGVGGLGAWDLMATTGGFAKDLAKPSSLSPFSKDRAGWIPEFLEITVDGVYTIRPSILFPDYYIIKTHFPTGESLVIENRQPIGSDAELPGGVGGLLIYHWDENVQDRFGTWSYPGTEQWPDTHYKFRLIQADGQFHLEKGENDGDAGDLFLPGMELGPGPDHPNTDTYFNGPTNIRISNITQLDNGAMTFRVEGVQEGPTSAPVVIEDFDGGAVPPPSQGTAECARVQKGDLQVWALNAVEPDEIAFFTVATIPASVGTLYLTDNAWNGTHLVDTEGTRTVRTGGVDCVHTILTVAGANFCVFSYPLYRNSSLFLRKDWR